MVTGPTPGDPMPGPSGGGMLLVAMREVDCCQGWSVVRGVRGREEPHEHRAHIRGSHAWSLRGRNAAGCHAGGGLLPRVDCCQGCEGA